MKTGKDVERWINTTLAMIGLSLAAAIVATTP